MAIYVFVKLKFLLFDFNHLSVNYFFFIEICLSIL